MRAYIVIADFERTLDVDSEINIMDADAQLIASVINGGFCESFRESDFLCGVHTVFWGSFSPVYFFAQNRITHPNRARQRNCLRQLSSVGNSV
jgi:hypothetical protein